MTENESELDGGVNTEDQEGDPDWLKTLRKKARDFDKVNKELGQYKRQDAVKQAGLDPENNPAHQLLIDKFGNEVPEPDQLKEEAQKYGLLNEQSESNEQELSEQEQKDREQFQRLNNVQEGKDDAAPNPEPEWKKAQTKEEFYKLYDGQVAS